MLKVSSAWCWGQVMQDTNSAFPQAYSQEAPKGHMLQGAPSIRMQACMRPALSPAHTQNEAMQHIDAPLRSTIVGS